MNYRILSAISNLVLYLSNYLEHFNPSLQALFSWPPIFYICQVEKKPLIPLYRDLHIVIQGVVQLILGQLQIKCPLCGSYKDSTNGTRLRKDGRVEAIICKNPNCRNGNHKTPKQFILTTSYEFKNLVFNKLKRLYKDLNFKKIR